MTKALVIITGTFNPITKAHLEMGHIARSVLGDDTQVIYVPAPAAFLQSWKQMKDTEIIQSSLRVKMIESAVTSCGFLCDTCEIDGAVSGKTYDTLTYLANKYQVPKESTYLVCGSDKLSELHTWYRAGDLLTDYHILVIQREFDHVSSLITKDSFLKQYQDRFTITSGNERLQTCSATKVREAIKVKDRKTITALMPEQAFCLLEGRIYG